MYILHCTIRTKDLSSATDKDETKNQSLQSSRFTPTFGNYQSKCSKLMIYVLTYFGNKLLIVQRYEISF